MMWVCLIYITSVGFFFVFFFSHSGLLAMGPTLLLKGHGDVISGIGWVELFCASEVGRDEAVASVNPICI